MIETDLSNAGYQQNQLGNVSRPASQGSSGATARGDSGASLVEEELPIVSVGFMALMAFIMLVPGFLLLLGGLLWML